MKTGILTFVHTTNYGAILQAYAMQTLLTEQGIDCEFIDYHCPEIAKNHDPKLLWRRPGVKNKLLWLLQYRAYSRRMKNFLRFEETYLRFSSHKYVRSNISESVREYDRFVVGSDQVWNPALTGGDMTYFLDFVPERSKKLSYAASTGAADFPEEYGPRCRELVRQFASVNVREQSARRVLEAHGIAAQCVPDPTLMLDKAHWMKFVGARPRKNKYVFMYMPPSDKAALGQILDYAKKNNLEVYQVQKGIRPTRGVHTLNTLSPEEFLTWLYHAELVVSGSFHGVCFSVLFEKPFIAFTAPKAELTTRIDDLLEALGLMERKYTGQWPKTHGVIYDSVQKRLTKLRMEGMQQIEKTKVL